MQSPSSAPNPPGRAQVLVGALRVVVPLVAVAVIVVATIAQRSVATHRSVLEERESALTELHHQTLASDLAVVASDLQFLVEDLSQERFFEARSQAGGTASSRLFDRMGTKYLSFAKARRLYDQVRLLDHTGQELIRVNYKMGWPVVVPEAQLQNKGSRYYFADAFVLEDAQVFVSPLDLNMERGEIERPLKPMIRVGTPVFDAGGQKRGILLLNYLGEQLLKKLDRVEDDREIDVLLVNSAGYFLRGPTADVEWGFMYEDRAELTMAQESPDEWSQILAADEGQFESDGTLYSFRTLYPLQEGQISSSGSGEYEAASESAVEGQEYFWKVVRVVPPSVLFAKRREIVGILLWALGPVGVALILSAFWLGKARAEQRMAGERLGPSEAS